MNKTETIVSVMEAFDEIERLTNENKELKRMNTVVQITENGLAVGPGKEAQPRWFAAIHEFGRRGIWEKYGERRYYRMDVDVREHDDGTKTVESFAHWFKDNYSEFPDFMSREDFLQEFEAELKARYDEEREKALKED